MAEYVINKERIASLRRLGEELANYVSEIRYGTERMLWYAVCLIGGIRNGADRI